MSDYLDFLKAKMPKAECLGFAPASEAHASLFPHQRDIAVWAVMGGLRAIFAAFGLGKTRIHLQVAKWIVEHYENKSEVGSGKSEVGETKDHKLEACGTKYLIIAPLGVRHVFTAEDGPAMGMEIVYCRTDEEVAAAGSPFIITNYERVRDGGITVSAEVFCGVGLDEASVLRSFGSKTYQSFLGMFKAIPHRFVFTATPSPNRHKELIHYGGFLGVMDTGEALTRFFKRDSSQAGNLTLYPHMEERFWLWLSSWAVFIQKPSDLGYSDEGYDLPEMQVHWHSVDVDHTKAWNQMDSWGQRQLIQDQSNGLRELAEVKRETVAVRIQKAIEIMGGEWQEQDDQTEKLLVEIINAIRIERKASVSFVQRRFRLGYTRANALVTILEERRLLGPYNNGKDREILEEKQLSLTARDKHWLLWHELEAEREMIEDAIPEAKTVYGSQDLDEREALVLGFAHGEYRILATKPILAGSGCNFQRHCSNAIFLGSSYKFNDFIQAVHRIQRFQQKETVNIHVIFSESEAPVIEALKTKWRQHNELVAKMTALLRQYRLKENEDMKLKRDLGCEREEVQSETFRAIRNDCVEELKTWEDNSVHLYVTSIPFGNQYEYSASFNDFGHNYSNEDFFKQMDFLLPHVLRTLMPGRLACIHVKDRIRFGNVTGKGMPTVDRFSDKTADIFEKHGFEFMGRITIETDVVRENNQTYRLGWSENAKDSTKMGVGMPEYVLLLRKLPSDNSKAYADVPVTKIKTAFVGYKCPECSAQFKNLEGVQMHDSTEESDEHPPHKCPECRKWTEMITVQDTSRAYTRAQWQIDAAGFWKSGGNRLPDPELLVHIPHTSIGKIWKEHARNNGYDYREHVDIGCELEARGKLPASFMLFPPVSLHPEIWTDIARMRTLNSDQAKWNEEQHVCPLQLDIVERLIGRYSNPGEIVADFFAGIHTVPYVAVKMGRTGWGVELNWEYWRCGVGYCEQAEAERTVPTLFDMAALGEPVVA